MLKFFQSSTTGNESASSQNSAKVDLCSSVFSLWPLEAMADFEKESLANYLGSWMSQLFDATEGLMLLEPEFCDKVFNLLTEIQNTLALVTQ